MTEAITQQNGRLFHLSKRFFGFGADVGGVKTPSTFSVEAEVGLCRSFPSATLLFGESFGFPASIAAPERPKNKIFRRLLSSTTWPAFHFDPPILTSGRQSSVESPPTMDSSDSSSGSSCRLGPIDIYSFSLSFRFGPHGGLPSPSWDAANCR